MSKQLSNPFSTGGGGVQFETWIQSLFVVLMETQGFAPGLPCWPIYKIKLQGRHAGYETDDAIVFVKEPNSGKERKMLCQIKHSIEITDQNETFGEVIQAAWNDFKNPKIFTQRRDIIALITGPLRTGDRTARHLLEYARAQKNSDEFFINIEKTSFISDEERAKCKAFRNQSFRANKDKPVSDEELFQFLRHFHLLTSDLDVEAGINQSLLHSLIGQYSPEQASAIWSQIVVFVGTRNKNAGTITRDNLPDEIKVAFTRHPIETIPENPAKTLPAVTDTDWNQHNCATQLAIANLVGSWNESDADKKIISIIANDNYDSWILKVRPFLDKANSPLSFKNGTWAVTERKKLWQMLGPRLFDDHLKRFKECTVEVLAEKKPQFQLSKEQRWAAAIRGYSPSFSRSLRKGVAEGLALLGNFPDALPHCSRMMPENTVAATIQEIFENADWMLWGSLDDVLPLLAEAHPNSFLGAVETALKQNPCPFDELFAQEGPPVTGENYLVGLLWALETLAWEEQHLTRVSIILGNLASRDPGGNHGNRPANSLITIFLPWMPQTTAPVAKRKVAVRAFLKDFPTPAWTFLLHLAANLQQITHGSHKPRWRGEISKTQNKRASPEEYQEQITFYAETAVEIAKGNVARLNDLIGHLNRLPESSFHKLLSYLASDEIRNWPEQQRLPIWEKLVDFTSKEKQFSKPSTSFTPTHIAETERVAELLAPKNPLNLYHNLFTNNDALAAFGTGFEIRQTQRQNAIKHIFDSEGLDAVFRLVDTVDRPDFVGDAFGRIAEEKIDCAVLPTLLEPENQKQVVFVRGYVWGRYYAKGKAWVDQITTKNWSPPQMGRFLTCLPFIPETWQRAKELLGKHEEEYWRNTFVTPYQTKDNLSFAIEKLIEYGRPLEAIDCLQKSIYDHHPWDPKLGVTALLALLAADKPINSSVARDIVAIIQALQNDSNTNQDDLFRVEWGYLPLLSRITSETAPNLLEKRLASNPSFFCEVLSLAFRSDNESESAPEPSEKQKDMAQNAYQLLDAWRIPPGMQPEGNFSASIFNQWFQSVKKMCEKSGRLGVALSRIGHVLLHCPPDPNGLWIHHDVANILNGEDENAEKMRNAFSKAIFNSRGAHWVDPTGEPERELAAKYKQQADDVENAGYYRLAPILRNVAEAYEQEAAQIVREYQSEND